MAGSLIKVGIGKEDCAFDEDATFPPATWSRQGSLGVIAGLTKMPNLWLTHQDVYNALYYNDGAYTDVTVQAAIDEIGTDDGIVYLGPGTWVLSNDITGGSNIYFQFAPGALIQPAAGIKLTAYSPEHIIASPRQQIIDPTNNTTDPLAFTTGGKVSVLSWGVKGDNSTDDEDTIQACATAITNAGGGHIVFPDTGANYLISGRVTWGGVTTVEFLGNSSYAKITANEDGGFFVVAPNAEVTFINPRLDGNGDSLLGQNGIDGLSASTVRVYGGHIKNFKVSAGYTGGKAISADGFGYRLFVDGTRITDCHSAFNIKRDGSTDASTEGLHVEINNIYAEDCDAFFFGHIVNSTNNDGTLYSVSISNFNLKDCGSIGGVFVFNRASNIKITNGSIAATATYNSSTAVEAIFRGRGRKLFIDNVVINQDADAVIDIDPLANYAADTSAMGDNYYNFSATGTYDYLFKSDLTDSTHPNRVLVRSYIEAILTNDVNTDIVTPATRNGTTILKIIYGDTVLVANAATINGKMTTMSDLPSSNVLGGLAFIGGINTRHEVHNLSAPPSDANLDTAFGTPAQVGKGFIGTWDDAGAGTYATIVVSDGTNWWYSVLTKAV